MNGIEARGEKRKRTKPSNERDEVQRILRNLKTHSPTWVETLRAYIRKLEREARGFKSGEV